MSTPASPSSPPTAEPSNSGIPGAGALSGASEAPAHAEHGGIEEVAIAGDRAAYAVFAPPGNDATIVYLHGRCGNIHAFAPWAEQARRHATLLALAGDIPCKRAGRTKWGADTATLHERIQRAIAAAERTRGQRIGATHVVVIGYSEGSLRAEALMGFRPQVYGRGLLIAGPRPPHPENLSASKAVVLIAGALDEHEHLRRAAAQLARTGRPVKYLELPGAKHGEYGPEGGPVMGEALDWIFQQPP